MNASKGPIRGSIVALITPMLDDGSVAELNRGAEIEVNYTVAERRVVLRRGEALFTVAKNPARPFVVRAGGVDVRAVGTAFNVKLAGPNLEVLVTEGTVHVSQQTPATSASAPTELTMLAALTAGQELDPTADAVMRQPISSNASKACSCFQ